MPGVARLNDNISGRTSSNYCCTSITRDCWSVCYEYDDEGNCVSSGTECGPYY